MFVVPMQSPYLSEAGGITLQKRMKWKIRLWGEENSSAESERERERAREVICGERGTEACVRDTW